MMQQSIAIDEAYRLDHRAIHLYLHHKPKWWGRWYWHIEMCVKKLYDIFHHVLRRLLPAHDGWLPIETGVLWMIAKCRCKTLSDPRHNVCTLSWSSQTCKLRDLFSCC